jgi:hypothetical protein
MKFREVAARHGRGPIGLGLWWALVVGVGCSGTLPNAMVPSSCGNPCASLMCPPDTHCSVTSACAPSCVPDVLTPR